MATVGRRAPDKDPVAGKEERTAQETGQPGGSQIPGFHEGDREKAEAFVRIQGKPLRNHGAEYGFRKGVGEHQRAPEVGIDWNRMAPEPVQEAQNGTGSAARR